MGHDLIPMGSQLRVTLVKGVCVHLMDLIAETKNPKVLQSDIDNAFIQSHTKDIH